MEPTHLLDGLRAVSCEDLNPASQHPILYKNQNVSMPRASLLQTHAPIKANLSSRCSSWQTVTTPSSCASGEPLSWHSCTVASRRLSSASNASGRAWPGITGSAGTGRETAVTLDSNDDRGGLVTQAILTAS